MCDRCLEHRVLLFGFALLFLSELKTAPINGNKIDGWEDDVKWDLLSSEEPLLEDVDSLGELLKRPYGPRIGMLQ